MSKISFPTLLLIFLISSGLISCDSNPKLSPAAAPEADLLDPVMTLDSFFESLSKKDYHQEAGWFGGNWDILRSYNPDINPDDLPAMLENAYQENSFQCQPINQVLEINKTAENEFTARVTFTGGDGKIFVLGQSCGASIEDSPPVSIFSYRIQKTNEDPYQVLDLPVYVP